MDKETIKSIKEEARKLEASGVMPYDAAVEHLKKALKNFKIMKKNPSLKKLILNNNPVSIGIKNAAESIKDFNWAMEFEEAMKEVQKAAFESYNKAANDYKDNLRKEGYIYDNNSSFEQRCIDACNKIGTFKVTTIDTSDEMREYLNNIKTNTMSKEEIKEILLQNNVVFLAKNEEEFEIIKAWFKERGIELSCNYSINYPYVGIIEETDGIWSLESCLTENAKRMELINGMVIHPNIPYLFWDYEEEDKEEGYFTAYVESETFPFRTKNDPYKHIKPIPIEEEIKDDELYMAYDGIKLGVFIKGLCKNPRPATQEEKIAYWKEIVQEGKWYVAKTKKGEFVFHSKKDRDEDITDTTISFDVNTEQCWEMRSMRVCCNDEIISIRSATEKDLESFMTKVGDKWVLTHDLDKLKRY